MNDDEGYKEDDFDFIFSLTMLVISGFTFYIQVTVTEEVRMYAAVVMPFLAHKYLFRQIYL